MHYIWTQIFPTPSQHMPMHCVRRVNRCEKRELWSVSDVSSVCRSLKEFRGITSEPLSVPVMTVHHTQIFIFNVSVNCWSVCYHHTSLDWEIWTSRVTETFTSLFRINIWVIHTDYIKLFFITLIKEVTVPTVEKCSPGVHVIQHHQNTWPASCTI